MSSHLFHLITIKLWQTSIYIQHNVHRHYLVTPKCFAGEFLKLSKRNGMSFKTKFLGALSASSELSGDNYREHFVIREAFRRIFTESQLMLGAGSDQPFTLLAEEPQRWTFAGYWNSANHIKIMFLLTYRWQRSVSNWKSSSSMIEIDPTWVTT